MVTRGLDGVQLTKLSSQVQLTFHCVHLFASLKGNPLYDIVKQHPDIFQFKKKSLFADDLPYSSDEYGRVYDRKMVLELYELYREWNLEGKALWIDRKKSAYSSYTDFMVHKLEEHIANESEENKVIKRAILKRLLKSETLESGCATMDVVSINEYGSYAVPSGPNLEFPGGKLNFKMAV